MLYYTEKGYKLNILAIQSKNKKPTEVNIHIIYSIYSVPNQRL